MYYKSKFPYINDKKIPSLIYKQDYTVQVDNGKPILFSNSDLHCWQQPVLDGVKTEEIVWDFKEDDNIVVATRCEEKAREYIVFLSNSTVITFPKAD